MFRCTKLTFCVIVFITCVNIHAKEYNWSIEPEIYIGVSINSGYNIYGGPGGTVTGGIRINKRHLLEVHLLVTRILPWVTDAPEPENNFMFETGTSYLFTLFNVKNIFSADAGVQLNIIKDEMLSHMGYVGTTARLSIGKNRTAWFVQGIVSNALILDTFGGYSRTAVSCALITTGVRIRL